MPRGLFQAFPWIATIGMVACGAGNVEPILPVSDLAAAPSASASASLTAPAASARVANSDGRDETPTPGANGPRDPVAMVGDLGNVEPHPRMVCVLNSEALRGHPIGRHIGPLILAMSQWRDYLGGTPIDPIADAQWIMMAGPSLSVRSTQDNVNLVYYAGPESIADDTLRVIAKHYASSHPVDTGVPGVKATTGFADGAERVFLQPQAHVIGVVPPARAIAAASVLKNALPNAHVLPGEAVRVAIAEPSGALPMLSPKAHELVAWITLEDDGGAHLFVEIDTEDHAAAREIAAQLTTAIASENAKIVVRLATRGLLNDARFHADGNRVRFRLDAEPAQVDELAGLWAAQTGVNWHSAGPTPHKAP